MTDAPFPLMQRLQEAGLTSCASDIESWLNAKAIAPSDKETVLRFLDSREHWGEVRESFYTQLAFGTGGMRGIRGPGPNRMNRYMVRRAAGAMALAVLENGPKPGPIVIAYDSRIGSQEFAQEAAGTLLAYGVPVALFPTLQTTPALSFAVRHLGGAGGICMTASHNPPPYNGFKMYGPDGAQMIPPFDKRVMELMDTLKDWDAARYLSWEEAQKSPLLQYVGPNVLDAYFRAVGALQLGPTANRTLKVVYTPLHGTGFAPVLRALSEWGFEQVAPVPQQCLPDGRFPTVSKPNPEEAQAMSMAIAYATQLGFPFVAATDPDSDRLAIAIRDPKRARGVLSHQAHGDYVLLNGNQTGALMLQHVLSHTKQKRGLTPRHAVVKTIVTSQLLDRIGHAHGVAVHNTLTGFKWIAGLVRDWEQDPQGPHYLFGTEESYGYMPGTYVRDKDGVAALCMAADMCDGFEKMGITACDALFNLFAQHGAWCEDLISLDLEGEAGAQKIQNIMAQWRSAPANQLGGLALVGGYDLHRGTAFGNIGASPLQLPRSDVLQFLYEGGTQVSMRPSGTEPKLKIYISVCDTQGDPETAFQNAKELCQKIKIGLIELLNQ